MCVINIFIFNVSADIGKQNNKDEIGGGGLGLKEVKNTYKDIDDYISTFEPLLFEEVKAQIAQKNDDEEGLISSLFSVWFLRKKFHH